MNFRALIIYSENFTCSDLSLSCKNVLSVSPEMCLCVSHCLDHVVDLFLIPLIWYKIHKIQITAV